MGFYKRLPPLGYDPSTDSNLVMWLDPSDSSTSSLLDTGGGSISDGETIGTYKSKAGTARNFTQWGSNDRPIWVANGINGLGVVHSNVQVLATSTSMSEFNSMSGMTVMGVHKVVVQRSASEGLDCIFSTTQIDSSDNIPRRAQYYLASRSDAKNRVGGRRLTSQGFAYITSTITPNANGSIVTGVLDWANALGTSYEGGVLDHRNVAFQTAGTTSASEPHYFSIGAIALAADAGGTPGSFGDSCNSYIGEILVWKSAMTPDQLVPAHHYLRRKWCPTL